MSRAHLLVQGGGLALLVVLAFANSLENGFHYDDFHGIVDNPHIRSLAAVPRLFTDGSTFSGDPAKRMYRPLTVSTFALNYAVGGYAGAGYHGINIALHAGCVLLVWALALSTGARPMGALVGGVAFALHPLVTEPVNYISSRSESLAALAVMATLLLFVRAGRSARPWVWRGASLCTFMLGLLAKEVSIVTPVVLLAGQRWLPRWRAVGQGTGVDDGGRGAAGRWWDGMVRVQSGYWIVAGGYLGLYGLFSAQSFGQAAQVRGMWSQLGTQLKAVPYYLTSMVMPVSLCVEHQFGAASGGLDWPVMLAGLFTVSLLAAMSRCGDRRTWVWMVLAAATMAPTFFVPLNVLVNEHRLYLPLAAAALVLARWWPPLARERGGRPGRWRPVVLGMALLLVFWALTWQRNRVWASEMSLWRDAAAKSPMMPRAQVHLGNALQAAGDYAGARQAYQRALAVDPRHRAARTNLGNLLLAMAAGQPQRRAQWVAAAAAEYEAVLRVDSLYAEALNNLGTLRLREQDLAGAAALFTRVTVHYPNFAEAYYNLALVARAQADYQREAELLKHAIVLGEDAALQEELGHVEARLGHWAEAVRAYGAALRLQAEEPRHRYNLAQVLWAAGRERLDAGDRPGAQHLWEQARRQLRQLLADPSFGQRAAVLWKRLGEASP